MATNVQKAASSPASNGDPEPLPRHRLAELATASQLPSSAADNDSTRWFRSAGCRLDDCVGFPTLARGVGGAAGEEVIGGAPCPITAMSTDAMKFMPWQ
eukprot:scaffold14563_cov242-Isochrysis_galbana.AAC.3